MILQRILFNSYLDTAGIPDPDLLIRTSGEIRLSYLSFMAVGLHRVFILQMFYGHDFNKEELKKAIVKYNERDRRFGAEFKNRRIIYT